MHSRQAVLEHSHDVPAGRHTLDEAYKQLSNTADAVLPGSTRRAQPTIYAKSFALLVGLLLLDFRALLD